MTLFTEWGPAVETEHGSSSEVAVFILQLSDPHSARHRIRLRMLLSHIHRRGIDRASQEGIRQISPLVTSRAHPSGCSEVTLPFLQGSLLFPSSSCVQWKELCYCLQG
eukprot:s3163_g4.t1